MRDFLNAILAVIGSSSLTDDEFDALTIESASYDQDTYEALSDVLIAREAVSSMQDRLQYYFQARGVEIDEVNDEGNTNIWLGSVLE